MGYIPVFFFIFLFFLVSNAEVDRFFIFGDSLVDVGNNNYINTLAKANIRPNGVDFVPTGGRPTGRFCNGKTVLDIIGDEFEFSCYPPPYLASNSNDHAAKCGINYASGAAGLLNKTGFVFVGRITMNAQIDNFANTRKQQISLLGTEKAMQLIRKSVFAIVIGSNDFLGNYLLPVISEGTTRLIPPEIFTDHLITTFRGQLQRLIKLGARKIAFTNIAPIGCIPYQREVNPQYGSVCAANTNKIVMIFNTKLKHLTTQLNSEFPEAKLVYLNIFKVVGDLIQNFARYGFEVADSGCCKTIGRFGGIVPCGTGSTYCSNRSKYFFWDPFHPSEEANKLIAKGLVDGDLDVAYPINLRKLLQL